MYVSLSLYKLHKRPSAMIWLGIPDLSLALGGYYVSLSLYKLHKRPSATIWLGIPDLTLALEG
jgi:hypothetical protein